MPRKRSGLPRGRPAIPLPPIYWQLRVDCEPPELCRQSPEFAKLLYWQITIVKKARTEDEKSGTVSIPTHFEPDVGERGRYLVKFSTGDQPLHGHIVFRREPPPGTVAVIRIRGLNAPPVAEVPLSKVEKVDQQLDAITKQHPEEIARQAATNPEVLRLIAEALGGASNNRNKGSPSPPKPKSAPAPSPRRKRRN